MINIPKHIEEYTNLSIKDPNKDVEIGCRVIIEYETKNEFGESVKVFCVFPPQTLCAPNTEEVLEFMLSNRLKDMKLEQNNNIIIHNKKSAVWKRYIRSLNP